MNGFSPVCKGNKMRKLLTVLLLCLLLSNSGCLLVGAALVGGALGQMAGNAANARQSRQRQEEMEAERLLLEQKHNRYD